MRTTASRQRGISMIGLFWIAVAIIFVAILGMKVVPAYVHNAQIAEIFKEIAADAAMQDASAHDIKMSYDKRASINSIEDISADDIDINKVDGRLIVSASYSVKIPLVANITLLLEFNPSSS